MSAIVLDRAVLPVGVRHRMVANAVEACGACGPRWAAILGQLRAEGRY